MLIVHFRPGLIGDGPRQTFEVPWRAGMTAADLQATVGAMVPAARLRVAVRGNLLEDADEIPDGATVLVANAPDAVLVPYLITAAISAAISVAASFIIQALFPRPKPPGVPAERGDESSPTYAWDGVQTSHGQGFTIPVVYGRHAVGGQVIYSDVFATTGGGSLVELLRVVLFLSEGPIYRIGDQLARIADGLGGYTGIPAGPAIPNHIRVNENLLDSASTLPGALVFLRPGTMDQPPLPTNPFRGATSTFTVGQRLDDAAQEAIFTYVGSDAISTVGFVFAAPSGLYQQDSQGNVSPYPVTVTVSWRPSGTTSWRGFYRPGGTSQPLNSWTFGQSAVLTALVDSFGGDLQPNSVAQTGPFEVRVLRNTPAGAGGTAVSTLLWRSVALNINQPFGYPGSALLGLELLATGRAAGQIPNFNVRVDGALVRVWDSVQGFSAPCWDIPAAPFNFMTQPPGRNPAWILADFLTNKRWGLGAYIIDGDLDWPSFRNWAAFCDTTAAGGWNEPALRCDIVLDAPRPAWEVVLAICAAGRAAPIWRNGKIAIVYQYRDAHGDGGIYVPAKATVQLLTGGLCEKVQVRWLPRYKRPTALQFQYLNEAQLWTQDVLTIEDTEDPDLNDPSSPFFDDWRPEVVQAYGVTRASQLVREGTIQQRAMRLIRRELTFECGPWLLAAEVGDLIDFEHDLLRPFGADVPMAMQVLVGGTGVQSITVDHAVSGSVAFSGRLEDGSPVYKVATATTPTTVGGRPATVIDFAGAITIADGAAIAVGKPDKIVETYQIVSVTIGKNLRRSVRALQWVPEVYDNVPLGIGADDVPDGYREQPLETGEPVLATDLAVVEIPGGRHRIGWARPEGRGSARARVYARGDAGAELWFLLDETAQSELEVGWFAPGRSYEVAVVLETPSGSFSVPELGTRLTFTAGEFPAWCPIAPTNVQAVNPAGTNAVVLSWDLLDPRNLEAFEVRIGDDWAAGVPVYSGLQPSCRLDPAPGHLVAQVAARARSGLYGPRTTVTLPATAVPYVGAAEVDETEHAPATGGGTHSGTEVVDASAIALTSGTLVGTFTSDEVDLGYSASFWLRVALSARELDGATVDECTFGVDSGEARWRTVDTRPASPAMPGGDWSLLVDDLAGPIDDLPDDLRANGTLGEPGAHVAAVCESRTYSGGWSAWARHQDRFATCSKWQARIKLMRSTAVRSVRVETFRLETLI